MEKYDLTPREERQVAEALSVSIQVLGPIVVAESTEREQAQWQ